MAIVGEYREGRREREAMIVNLEAKMGQAQTRGRSRRAAEVRLEVVEDSMHVSNSGTVLGMTSAPIVVDDEDDDVVVSSPRSFAQAVLRARLESQQPTRHAVTEDPLELRLGPGGESSLRTSPTQQPRQGRRGRPARPTIDLTTPSRTPPVNDDCVVILEYAKSRKRKNPVPLEPAFMTEVPPITPVQEAESYKLNCAICMDTMKEETSTICGHIFCRNCIYGAINSQKKCPTCRKKLTLKNTHRIYL
ncbi:hypothetical protein M758_8G168200 [Ceratodon purpureus]|nr:hypothetical protein M758_8G168200 [Ceratodon purpureus]